MMDLFQIITDRIVAELEQGVIPWQKPWSGTQGAISHTTGKCYSLLNQILLGCRSGEFVTFKEAQREGGHIKKGEKASMIAFWKFIDSAKRDDSGNVMHGADGKPVMESVPFLRYYNVFHIDQCEGLQPRFAEDLTPGEHLAPDDTAEQIVKGYVQRSGVKLTIQHSDRAFYSPSSDSVTVPELAQYTSVIFKKIQSPFDQEPHFAECVARDPHEIVFQLHRVSLPYRGGGQTAVPKIRFTAFSALPAALTINRLSSFSTCSQFWM